MEFWTWKKKILDWKFGDLGFENLEFEIESFILNPLQKNSWKLIWPFSSSWFFLEKKKKEKKRRKIKIKFFFESWLNNSITLSVGGQILAPIFLVFSFFFLAFSFLHLSSTIVTIHLLFPLDFSSSPYHFLSKKLLS